MGKIRIGVMGCASIAERSMIPAIKSLSDRFELIGVASRSLDKANSFGRQFNCEAIDGYEALVNRADVDAIYMPLPTGLHKEWIMKALQAGKHIYAEKSLASCYEDCRLFVEVAASSDLVLMEGYMFLYHSQHQRALEILNSDVIGEIRHFSASFGFPPLKNDNFRYDNKLGGGALLDCAGYTVRAASFILQSPLNVRASYIKYDANNTSIYGSGLLVSETNIPASFSFGFDNFYQCKYEIWGSAGKLTATKAFTPREKESPILVLETDAGMKQIVCDSDNHFQKIMLEFANRIEHRKQHHYDELLKQSELLDQIACCTQKKIEL